MDYLEKVGFLENDIKHLNENIPPLIHKSLVLQSKLVLVNIQYLKSQGIENYKDLFKRFYEVFLMDYTDFKNIFEKYDRDELIEFLKNDINLLEFL
ncbi:MAG: hypothetical protein R3Y13_02620 [bacterium]